MRKLAKLFLLFNFVLYGFYSEAQRFGEMKKDTLTFLKGEILQIDGGSYHISLLPDHLYKETNAKTEYRDSLNSAILQRLSLELINGDSILIIDFSKKDEDRKSKIIIPGTQNSGDTLQVKLLRFRVRDMADPKRLIPVGNASIFLDFSEVRFAGFTNDNDQYALIEQEWNDSVLTILKERKTDQYYLSDSTFLIPDQPIKFPLALSGEEALFPDGDSVVIEEVRLIKSNLVIIALVVCAVFFLSTILFGLLYFLIRRGNTYIQHEIRKNDSLSSIVREYDDGSGILTEEVLCKKNRKLLKGIDPLNDQNKRFHQLDETELRKVNRVGNTLKIPKVGAVANLSSGTSNDSSSIQTVAKESKATTDNNHDSRLRNIEESINDLKKILHDSNQKQDVEEVNRLKELGKELERKLDNSVALVEEQKTNIKQLKSDLEQQKSDLTEEREKSERYKEGVKKRVLILKDQDSYRSFAEGRIALIRRMVEVWQGLEKLLLKSIGDGQNDQETLALSIMLHRPETGSLITHAQVVLEDLVALEKAGVWSDWDVVRKLQNEKSEAGKLAFLDKELTEKLFAPLLSKFLPIMEDASNLERLLDKKSELISAVQTLGQKARDIRRNAGITLNLEVHQVKLFDDVMSYQDQVKAVGQEPDLIHAKVDIPVDHIAQIIALGFEWEGHKTKTKVILKEQ